VGLESLGKEPKRLMEVAKSAERLLRKSHLDGERHAGQVRASPQLEAEKARRAGSSATATAHARCGIRGLRLVRHACATSARRSRELLRERATSYVPASGRLPARSSSSSTRGRTCTPVAPVTPVLPPGPVTPVSPVKPPHRPAPAHRPNHCAPAGPCAPAEPCAPGRRHHLSRPSHPSSPCCPADRAARRRPRRRCRRGLADREDLSAQPGPARSSSE
jgi:hypothetical protein